MKKFIAILLIPVLFACGREAKQKAQELQASNDSLIRQSEQKDVAINDFATTVNSIQSILDSIKTKEKLITENTYQMGERNTTAREQIHRDIKIIYAALLEDKERLNSLSKKLAASGQKVKEFQVLVDRLQQDITSKNQELETLRSDLERMNFAMAAAQKQIDTLNHTVADQGQQIQSQSTTIANQTTALNTAYYIVGTREELKSKGIIKAGKVVSDFNRSAFKKVDITQTKEIPLADTKVKILTNHPASSFVLNKEGNKAKSLEVTDYLAFWSATKYLVVETNEPVNR